MTIGNKQYYRKTNNTSNIYTYQKFEQQFRNRTQQKLIQVNILQVRIVRAKALFSCDPRRGEAKQ